MNRTERSPLVCAIGIVLAVFILHPVTVTAQTVTNGTLRGTVTDQQNAVLPGATVTATHMPTGTKYETVTGADGRYQIPNVRVGGPYTVTATLSGFRDKVESEVNVALGAERTVDFKLQLATITEVVTVTASAPDIDTARAGTAANIAREALENLPTIQRSIFDFARTSSFVNATAAAAGNDTSISIAGRNNRYNNMQIDGAVNNDVFGIPDGGVPGGQTGSQPISLDAIQEVQIVVAPYDVRQGGFSGGAVNAVTRSGTNAFSGTAYWVARNESLIGKIPAIATPAVPDPQNTAVGAFKDRQGGFSLGGPIARNRAFFFGNLDLARKSTPSGFSADASSGQAWGGINAAGVAAHLADLQRIIDISKARYGYDPGALSEITTPTDADKYFVRGDFNLSPRNQLTARINAVNSNRQLSSSGVPSTTAYAFPYNFYTAEEKVFSPVVQLNTTFTQAFNEFRFTYTRDRFSRTNPTPVFPHVRINFPDNLNVRLGTENSSQANRLNQDIAEVTDDFTWIKGRHTITIGTHNEFFKFWNLFIQNLYGQWEFGSVQNFQDGFAQFYQHSFSNTSDPLQPAEFSVRQFGVYVGDQWRAAANLTLAYGVRLDVPQFPDTPHANPLAVTDFGYRTDIAPAPKMWSPRIGFNWDLTGEGTAKSQVRGGIGYFTGRTPYVWLSNQYSNTGVDFTTISTTNVPANRIPFVADPNAQPTTVTGAAAGRQNINLVDPDYKFPAIVRGNIAYDRDLGFWGLIASSEFLASRNVEEIAYQNINFVPSGSTLPDGRIVYRRFDANLGDVLLLTNTSRGSTWSASFKLERPFRSGFYASGSYLYNDAKSINDGTASTAGSNWANNPIGIDTNNPPLTRSNFAVGNRVNLTAVIPIPLGKGLRSTAAFYYNGQSGRPYVIQFSGDANLDNRTANDIAFIPASADQVVVMNGTWDQLDAFLSNDPASKDNRGTIPARNSGRAPWSNTLDFRYGVNLPTGSRAKVELTMDVINLLNLLNKDWGWQYFPLFPSVNGLLGYGGIDPATGKERLNLSTITSQTFQGTFQRDDLRSRWQAQWGVRVRF